MTAIFVDGAVLLMFNRTFRIRAASLLDTRGRLGETNFGYTPTLKETDMELQFFSLKLLLLLFIKFFDICKSILIHYTMKYIYDFLSKHKIDKYLQKNNIFLNLSCQFLSEDVLFQTKKQVKPG